jgi:phage regulator Rha-like protein
MAQFQATTPALTMSSQEIAELTEVRHDSVKRTIETLGGKGVITLPQIVEVSNSGPGPKRIGVYHVNQRDSYVIVAQLSPEFTARLVDRWQELEQQAAQPMAIPQATSISDYIGALSQAVRQGLMGKAKAVKLLQARLDNPQGTLPRLY